MSREWKEALNMTTPEDLDMQEIEEEMLDNLKYLEELENEQDEVDKAENEESRGY